MIVSIKDGREVGFLAGVMVPTPQSKTDYLVLCKKFLTEGAYIELLCSIMDKEYYRKADITIQRVVDAYFSFRF